VNITGGLPLPEPVLLINSRIIGCDHTGKSATAKKGGAVAF